jgi:hypothetical protein
MKRFLDIQRILNRSLPPASGLENIQAELISYLDDKNDEFYAYNKLPIEHIINYVDGNTVFATHYSWLISEYAEANNLTGIEAIGISPAQLPEICQGKDTLIITNPALAALILVSPNLLSEVAQKLKRNLVLAVRSAPRPVRILWEGFFDKEHEKDERLFRWAEGGKDNWRIYIFNLKTTPVIAELKWSAESLCGIGELTASCRNETISTELNSLVEFKLNVTLQPGNNELHFNFSGQSQSSNASDIRILAFRIINFSYRIDNMDISTDEDFIHEDNKLLLTDNFIRHTLHINGFYDVTATAYANHGISRRELEKTKYEYPFSYRIVSSFENNAIERDDIVCYKAYRLSRTENI